MTYGHWGGARTHNGKRYELEKTQELAIVAQETTCHSPVQGYLVVVQWSVKKVLRDSEGWDRGDILPTVEKGDFPSSQEP